MSDSPSQTHDADEMAAARPTGGILYVAATPLGNLGDISARLRDTLAAADLVLAEDTRRSGILMAHLQLHRPLRSLHTHNEAARLQGVCEAIQAGQRVVLLTDAGTPAVSDPGARLVAGCHAAGLTVCPIPGPSALTAAMSAAGFAPGPHGAVFLGFLPRSGRERQEALVRLHAHDGTVVLFESPERLVKTVAELAAEAPHRLACLCRELTKMHEEVRRCTLAELEARLAEVPPRGEITLVLAPLEADAHREAPAEAALRALVERVLAAGVSARDAATALSLALDVPRRQIYALAHAAASGAAQAELAADPLASDGSTP